MEKSDERGFQNHQNRIAQLKADQRMKENWIAIQRKKEETQNNKANTVQRQEGNSTQQSSNSGSSSGLPTQLKSGIENLSGQSMDDVKVHYNSDKPAQLQAHAFAQGNDIHLASGQEKHLPHEAWHVVQQKEGRVQPTRQMKGKGVNINDDAGLEREADVMGAKAMSMGNKNSSSPAQKKDSGSSTTAQMVSYDETTVQRRAFLNHSNSAIELVTEDNNTERDFIYKGPLSGFYSIGMDGTLVERTDLEDDQDFKYPYETSDNWMPEEDELGYNRLTRAIKNQDSGNVSMAALRESMEYLYVDNSKLFELNKAFAKHDKSLSISNQDFVLDFTKKISFGLMNELQSKYITSGEPGLMEYVKSQVELHNKRLQNSSNDDEDVALINISDDLEDWEYYSAALTAMQGKQSYETALNKICDVVATAMMALYGEGGLEEYDGLVDKINQGTNKKNGSFKAIKTTSGFEFLDIMRNMIASKDSNIAQIKIKANGLPHTFAIANGGWSKPAFVQAYEQHITLEEHVKNIGVFNYDAMGDIVVPLAEALNGNDMSGAKYNALFGGPGDHDVKISEIMVIIMPMQQQELGDLSEFNPKSGYMHF
ncbi:eCIS core domain-containing protein [Aureibacter tunicatorum]|uniref:eCIS core domain-containing protein n=1 Tax=Aureibacter tunicatorum TaxID=866807 RepID=A0AAE3XKL5_9BACT|nr:DUF4157 domain-containing protein [Aureibacter tunicatorum]MDR6237466.1 hypothetical protein [Aureibacter tunicatorum]BDD06455.1 hypothetical protein AUTU_39380 [Aureibacter tunicatorum]